MAWLLLACGVVTIVACLCGIRAYRHWLASEDWCAEQRGARRV